MMENHTGFESSVTNFLPLPCPVWEIVSKGSAPAGFGGTS